MPDRSLPRPSSTARHDDLVDENTVTVHINHLRAKIEDNPRAPRYLLTVWGLGYKFNK